MYTMGLCYTVSIQYCAKLYELVKCYAMQCSNVQCYAIFYIIVLFGQNQ